MDCKKLFMLYIDYIEPLSETADAEKKVSRLLNQLKEMDRELYLSLDSAIGTLALSYEMQGFTGGVSLKTEVSTWN